MTNLYRCFDGDGQLLYVGISWSTKRFRQHKNGKSWWREVATISIEHYPTRRQALNAEREAIQTEDPIYNRTHKNGAWVDADPDAPGQLRIVEASAMGDHWRVSLLTTGGVEVEWTGLEAATIGEAVDIAVERTGDVT